jgi:hypothetical protein
VFEPIRDSFAPWSGIGFSYNIGQFIGAAMGGAMLGFIAGTVRDFAFRTAKKSKSRVPEYETPRDKTPL